MEKTFVCKACNKEKPASEFYVWKRTGYRRPQCTECKRVHMMEYRHNNREHTNLTAKLSHQRAKRERPKSFFLYRARKRAKDLGLPFNLTEEDIIIPEYCPVLGIKLVPGGDGSNDNCPSIDRIIPELGYVKGNVKIISKRANTMKSFGTAEDHRKIVEYIERCLAEKQKTG